jgi:hypothetical protein
MQRIGLPGNLVARTQQLERGLGLEDGYGKPAITQRDRAGEPRQTAADNRYVCARNVDSASARNAQALHYC